MTFRIEYYEENGKNPVLEFISTLPTKDKAKILREIDMLAEFGSSLGKPYVKKMNGTDELWELRIKFGSNNYRIFYFCWTKKLIVLLHGIHKKGSKTPVKDIKVALERIKNIKRRDDYNGS